MELSSRIKNFWEADAESYSEGIRKELSGPVRDAWVELVLENAPRKEKLDILDVGTGPGFFPAVLTREGHRVTGIDLTENMIARAKKNLEDLNISAELLTMECQDLQFSDNHFDMIICRNLTWTLDNPKKAYAEWRRVLRPGGRMLVFDACWNLHLVNEETAREYKQKIAEIDKKYGEYQGKGHHDPEELEDISRKLFMTDKIRPQWDLETLLRLGFSKVFADVTVGERYAQDERQRAVQALHPPFVVGGEK
ncbi:MAG: class I SAM-dependent methyltransferase [Treponema sp.]|jgi:ubiquinone/menaquinone biosynthesis C-methylase UbiE|nr:class I SAM-dependent methyltransferase [Treponema sp.]